MSKYNCISCVYHTDNKVKYEEHKKTNKHLSIIDKNKDKIIECLRLEVSYLRGKVDAYEHNTENIILGPVKVEPIEPSETSETSQKELNNYDDEEFISTLELDVNEALAEEVAGLRTFDDSNCDIPLTEGLNAYEAFVNNPKNNLPYIETFRDMINNENAISDLIYNKVLTNCSVKVMDKYKCRFNIYKDNKWLDNQDSRDLVSSLFYKCKSHFKKYFKLLKIYYSYDSKLRELNPEKEKDIQFVIDKLMVVCSYNRDTDKDIIYILKNF